MIKRITAGLFRRLGMELRALPPAPTYTSKHQLEIDLFRSDIEAFYAASKQDNFWNTRAMLEKYLTNARIDFYHELLRHCVEKGVDFEGKTVADFGCGAGYLTRIIKKKYTSATTTAMDINPHAQEIISWMNPDGEADMINVIEGTDRSFDVVIMSEVLEHLADPNAVVENCLSSVNAGGTLVITVPDGRKDRTAADPPVEYENPVFFNGHINFWSPESWGFFFDKYFAAYNPRTFVIQNNFGGYNKNLAILTKP